VSLDQFYALVTGQDDAFYQMCMVLPKVIENVVAEGDDVNVPHDTVLYGLKNVARETGENDENLAMAMAIYLLGFTTYSGFAEKLSCIIGDESENCLKRLYAYANGFN
jgi:hypothetical protein